MRKFALFLSCLFFFVAGATAQGRVISGTVTDSSGSPINGASVTVKGSNRGTSTGADGHFSLSVESNAQTLVISSVNFGSMELDIRNKADLGSITLHTRTKSLDEVVVVAYGTAKKTNVTGSVITVSGAQLADKPFTSPDKMLQGAVAGLQAASPSGAPGSATSIRIRGIGSITASASPLWVIDGIIATTGDLTLNTTTANILSTLNPDDIESISVLKDAAATSIYGSRAANGVILVTTKKGKAGKTHVNFSTELGNNSVAYNPKNKPMTTLQYRDYMRQALINAGFATDNADADALIIDPNGFGFFSGYEKVNTDWKKVVTQSAPQAQYNLSMTGGNDKTQFYASAGYFKQAGTSIATDFKRYNGSLSITHKAADWATISGTINGSSGVQVTPTNGGAFANPVLAANFLLPFYTPRFPDGSLRYGDADSLFEFGINGGTYNPLVTAAFDHNQTRQTVLRGNIQGEFKLLPDLKFTTRYAGEYLDVSEDAYLNPFYGDGYTLNGNATSIYSRFYNWTWSNFFDYRHGLNAAKDIYFDLKVGYESQQNNTYTLQAIGQNFPGTLALQWLSSAATPTTASAVPVSNSTASMFAIGDVNIKDKYVISGSFRRDGSSVFGPKHRWGNFYSVGGTWNVNEEDFLKQSDVVSLLKLRTSYGENGNSLGFGNYTSLPTFGSGRNYTGNPGIALNNVGDSDLTWEKNKAFNVGIDVGLVKNRVTATVEYYHRTTSNLLAFVPFSPTVGIGGQNENIGSIVNKGFEITLGVKPVVTRDFTWSLSFNIAHNINRVSQLYNHVPVANGVFNITEGHDLQTFYLRQWAGVNSADGTPLWYTDSSMKATTGVYNSAKLVLNRSASPKFYGSLNNTFTYKELSLDVQFYYNYGNYIYDTWSTYQNSDGLYTAVLNQLSDETTAWQKPGDKTNVPKIIYGGNNGSYRGSSRFLYKGDYIRLRNLQLSYSIPQSVLKSIHLANITVYFRGTNLFTFGVDKHLPYDPEAGISSQTNLEVYIPKTITGGIKIGL